MNKNRALRRVLPLIGLWILATSTASADTGVPSHLVAFANSELVDFGARPEVVAAVRARNAEGETLDQIKEIDSAWQASDGVTRFMLDLMSNDLALALHNFEWQHNYIVETFVMDSLGANVGQTSRTSDYWQGDEAKFIDSYAGGRGAVVFSDVEYDESSDEVVIQVSVPVMDGATAIGAICFGISLDRWERR